MDSDDLAFVATKTTGTDPAQHEIIEIEVIRVARRTLRELASISMRIAPLHIERAEPGAMEFHGYSPATWGGGPIEDALSQIVPLFEDANPAGYNVEQWDLRFIIAACEKSCWSPPTFGDHVLDIAGLVWPLYHRGLLSSPSLSSACHFLGISGASCAHEAGAEQALAVARRLLIEEPELLAPPARRATVPSSSHPCFFLSPLHLGGSR